MTATYTVDGDAIVRARSGSVELTQCAENMTVGSGSLVIDDTAGTLEIVGQKDFAADELACSLAVTARGFVGARDYSRKSERQALAREIGCAFQDLNAMAGFRRIRTKTGMTTAEGGNRLAETVADRGAWLMASPFVDGLFADLGRCDFPTDKGMDAADYRNQHPGDVLADMVLASTGGAYNTYIRDFGDGPELVFRNDNASTDDTSTIRISNVIADVSGDEDGLTFFPFVDAVLTRDPSQVITDLGFYYANGSRTLEAPDTALAFNGERGATVSNTNIKTDAKALDEAKSILFQRSTEEDKIECTIQVPASMVNLINQGDRCSARFTHLTPEGYGDFSWFRVLSITKIPLLKAAALYNVRLTLSPQEPAAPVAGVVTIVQRAFGIPSDEFSFPNPVTIGNKLVYVVSERDGDNPTEPNIVAGNPTLGGTGGWTRFNSTNITSSHIDGCAMYWKVATATDQTVYSLPNTPAGIYELSGADPASATLVDADQVTSGPDYTTGSLTVGTDEVAIAIWIFGELDWPWGGGSPPGAYSWSVPNPSPGLAAGLTQQLSLWAFDSWVGAYYKVEHPWTTIADATGTGASLAFTITPGLAGKVFAGLAVRIPAL